MKVIIIEDCSADDLAAVLRPYTELTVPVEVPIPVKIDIPHKTVNPRTWSEEESAPIAAAASRDEALRAFFEKFPDSARTRKAVEGRWYRLQEEVPPTEPVIETIPKTEPEVVAVLKTVDPEEILPEPEPELPPEVPVGHSRSWRAVENDVVAQCSSWPQAVERYQEAFPESLRTPHAVEMRWYYLRKKGLLVAQEDEPEVSAPEEISEPEPVEEITVDRQPENDAAELTTLCYVPEWPAPPTDAPDIQNEDLIRALIGARCQVDIPSSKGGSIYAQGYIRRLLTDRSVLVECDRHGMCWCSLDDNVTLLEER